MYQNHVDRLLAINVSSQGRFANQDRTEKKAIYEENGVEEYWIVDTKRREITAYTLTGKRFGRGKVYTARDTLRSRVLDGLTLRVSEMFV